MGTESARRALVFGASGFLGRWLIIELAAQAVPIVAAVRSAESGERVLDWLGAHCVAGGVETVQVDFTAEDLGLGSDDPCLRGVSEVYNVAGAYRFGMTVQQAHEANVLSVHRIVSLAARLETTPRLVHVSGYRVSGLGGWPSEWTSKVRTSRYAELGAYEASKIEADAVVRAEATQAGVPFTIVNPSTVIGVGSTGETDQYLGLADTVRDLWNGALTALPGGASTFVPVVTVDHLARFMARIATLPDADGRAYWVLADDTPPLPDLLTAIGRHYQVSVPKLQMPVAVIKRLPRSITKADPETLSFMSSDRYPTESTRVLQDALDLQPPKTIAALLNWADHLAAYRFGAIPVGVPARGFATYADTRTFTIGDPDADTLVLPPLPLNADTWSETATAMTKPATVLDLPGLGMSAGDERAWQQWLVDVVRSRPRHLVGHSVGAAVAVEFAATHPEQLADLTLVAPTFLQPRASFRLRLSAVMAFVLRRASPGALSRTLLGSEEYAAELETSVADLRRRGVARRVARLLALGARHRSRQRLQTQVLNYPGRVHIVVGEHDPLSGHALQAVTSLGDRLTITTINGAGHYPQLTHPVELAHAIGNCG